MNLRQWARATHHTMTGLSVDERQRDLSMADLEWALRMAIAALVAALDGGETLSLEDLGQLWVEEKASRTCASNLGGQRRIITIHPRRLLRFRTSARFLRRLNTSSPTNVQNP